MATVNIANKTWRTTNQSNATNITASSSSVKFNMVAAESMCCAKACVEINASDYKTVTLKYSSGTYDGVTALYFGVFNNMTAQYYYNTEYDNGISSSSLSGIDVTEIGTGSSGTITINIPSGTSGTKYVGFLFYGNTYNAVYSTQRTINITSLTATERGYTLTYNANDGSGAPSSVSGVTSTTISSTVPTRTGYDFLGWSKSSSATSASYFAGDSISLTSNTTLYAVWKKVVYTITYNANGGSNAPLYQEKLHGEDLILTESKPTPPSRESVTYTIYLNANGGICDTDFVDVTDYTEYHFEGWNSDIEGTGDTYYSGGKYLQDSSVTLFAQYSSSYYDEETILPTPTRENHDFLGWATDPYATSGITGRYNPTNNVTLYAIWKCRGNVYICDGFGGFNPYQVLIYDGSGWNQYVPYIYTESGWEEYSG